MRCFARVLRHCTTISELYSEAPNGSVKPLLPHSAPSQMRISSKKSSRKKPLFVFINSWYGILGNNERSCKRTACEQGQQAKRTDSKFFVPSFNPGTVDKIYTFSFNSFVSVKLFFILKYYVTLEKSQRDFSLISCMATTVILTGRGALRWPLISLRFSRRSVVANLFAKLEEKDYIV